MNITYELIKELKDAKFPFKGEDGFSICSHCGDGGPEGLAPTLSELIEALGKGYLNIERTPTNWSACFKKNFTDIMVASVGYSIEETMANLWLELNKK